MTNVNNRGCLSGYARGPIAARAALAAALLETIAADFTQHGKEAIEVLRKERPHDYVKLVAALLPKDLQSEHPTIEEMTDDELASALVAVRSLVAATAAEQDGAVNAAANEPGAGQR